MAKKKPARTGPRPAEVADTRSTKRATSAPAAPAPQPKSGARATLERLSARPLAGFAALPTPVLPGILLALTLAGLLVPLPWAGLMLVVVGLLMAWLTAVSWPATSTSGRVVRVVVNLVLIGLGVTKILGLLGP